MNVWKNRSCVQIRGTNSMFCAILQQYVLWKVFVLKWKFVYTIWNSEERIVRRNDFRNSWRCKIFEKFQPLVKWRGGEDMRYYTFFELHMLYVLYYPLLCRCHFGFMLEFSSESHLTMAWFYTRSYCYFSYQSNKIYRIFVWETTVSRG